MKKVDNCKLVYNIPYSPQFNPVEYVNGNIKNKITKCNPTNMNQIPKLLQKELNKIKPLTLKKYFNKSKNELNK